MSLTVPEAAAYLKVTEVTIRRYAASGKLPAAKLGNTWRFSTHFSPERLRETVNRGSHFSRRMDGPPKLAGDERS